MCLQEPSNLFSQPSPFLYILFLTPRCPHPRLCARRSALTPYSSLFLQSCISFLLVPKQITICLVALSNTDLFYHSCIIQKSGHSQYQLGFCSRFHQTKSKCKPDCIIFWTLGKNMLPSLFRWLAKFISLCLQDQGPRFLSGVGQESFLTSHS